MERFASVIKYCAIVLSLISLACISYQLCLNCLRTSAGDFIESENNSSDYFNLRPKDIFKKIIPLYLGTRFIIFFTTYLFYIVSKNSKLSFLNSFKEIWFRWDSPHYVSIAQSWYQNTGEDKVFIVFYPLYPLAIKALNFIIKDYFVSGLFVSNVSLLAAIYFLFKLVELEYKDSVQAMRVVKYVLIFPFSFFFSIVYTESLFLALTIITFYYARKKEWIISGCFGMLAALTRNQGLLLVLPVFVEFLHENEIGLLIRERRIKKLIRRIIEAFTGMLLIPCGTFMYLLLNRIVTEEWLKFMEYQKNHWSQSFGFYGDNLKNHFINAVKWDIGISIGVWIPQLVLFFAAFALLIYCCGKMRVSYAVYSFAYIIISYSPTWLLSGPRYTVGMFTLFLMLGVFIKRYRWLEGFIDFALISLACFYSVLFFQGYVY